MQNGTRHSKQQKVISNKQFKEDNIEKTKEQDQGQKSAQIEITPGQARW